jgi:hypothetical protein
VLTDDEAIKSIEESITKISDLKRGSPMSSEHVQWDLDRSLFKNRVILLTLFSVIPNLKLQPKPQATQLGLVEIELYGIPVKSRTLPAG